MSSLDRWLGGSPLGVLLRLIVLSLIVGVILHALGLTPLSLLRSVAHSIESLFGFGWDAVEDIGRYVLTGAVIVIPIWLITRLASARR
ncbi:DUF6460 domain-containing protein [Enterovirga rhinocerotis]|uniref:DUF6460 domain-containing protein n=1 Tax=Enterovirga rhinocerotis TaxID=1339210 RepID=A0A4R7C632_9HYPH|nr:DUF6460 domain-containing protein [Enterovirga rhinocerotis]TDR94024.1 hypothetical protein EV668_1294 [Enterovirga rhinocerotis]